MHNRITLLQTLEGYLLYADACRLSPHTIADYTNTFRKFQIFLNDDPPITSITGDQARAFFVCLDHLSLYFALSQPNREQSLPSYGA